MKLSFRMCSVVLALVLTVTACGGGSASGASAGGADSSAKPKILKFGLEIAPDVSVAKIAQEVADTVKEKTNGSVVIEVYPSAQLGTQRDYIEGMMLGTIEIGYTSAAGVENFEPQFVYYDIPFTITGPEHAQKVWDSERSRAIQEKFRTEQGVRTLGMLDAGPRNIYTTAEVRTAADFSKLTMRVADVVGLINLFNALNANPTVIAFSDIYTGMSTGVVNGFEIGLESVLANNLQEVADYCVETCHTYTIDCFLMSEKAFSTLTPEEQTILVEAFDAACKKQAETFNGNLAGFQEKLAAAGVETIALSSEEMAKLQEMAKPAIEKSINGIFDLSVVDEIRAIQ